MSSLQNQGKIGDPVTEKFSLSLVTTQRVHLKDAKPFSDVIVRIWISDPLNSRGLKMGVATYESAGAKQFTGTQQFFSNIQELGTFIDDSLEHASDLAKEFNS